MVTTRLLVLATAVGAISLGSAPATVIHAPAAAPLSVRHTKLLRSSPAAGASLTTSPESITLWFSKPVQARLTRVQVVDAHGASVGVASPRTTDAGDTTVVVALKGRIDAGSYTVTWATTSRDSHVIKGSFAFTLQRSAAGGFAAR